MAEATASKTDLSDIFSEIRANHKRLNSCDYHEFEVIEPQRGYNNRYRCKHCQGVIDGIAYHWHEQGRRQK